MKAWTNQHFAELHDNFDQEAPIREVEVLQYDPFSKLCQITYIDRRLEVKSDCLYTKPGKAGQVPRISHRDLNMLVEQI